MVDAAQFNYFQAMTNPQFASRQLQIQQQQALAKQLMDSGSEKSNYAQLANPGGLVIPISPLAEAGKAVEKGLGGYMQGKALGDQMQAYQDLSDQQNPVSIDAMKAVTGGQPGMLTDEQLQQARALSQQIGGGGQNNSLNALPSEMFNPNPALGNSMYETRMAGIKKAAEESNTPRITPQGTYTTIPVGQPAAQSPSAPAPLPWLQQSNAAPSMPAPQPSPQMSPDNAAKMDSVYGSGAERPPAQPVVLSGASDQSPISPMAADGNPILPNMDQKYKSDPTGTPKFNTENTVTGVEQTKQDIKDAAEGNKAFASMAQSLGQEKARLDNLIEVYKGVQSGTLTAQNPELANKLIALGVIKDPSEIKDVAGIQNATQNHILQVIQQIKDTNANAGGGAPTRTFGSEISQLLENGESAKAQPEALWNVIGQAKGLVDHHLDMLNGWGAIGGLGNRQAAGYTMRPEDYAQQFTLSHNVSAYRDKALKDMGPFKGMAGNTGNSTNGWSYGGVVK